MAYVQEGLESDKLLAPEVKRLIGKPFEGKSIFYQQRERGDTCALIFDSKATCNRNYNFNIGLKFSSFITMIQL